MLEVSSTDILFGVRLLGISFTFLTIDFCHVICDQLCIVGVLSQGLECREPWQYVDASLVGPEQSPD